MYPLARAQQSGRLNTTTVGHNGVSILNIIWAILTFEVRNVRNVRTSKGGLGKNG